MARWFLLLSLVAASALAAAVQPSVLLGTWEAARTPQDERLLIRLLDTGKVEIVAEYDFQIPGQPGKRRGRSTTYGRWSVKGDEVTLRYASVRDRLRYRPGLSLSQIGLQGNAAALQAVGEADPKSRLGDAVLWKGPHDYKLASPPEPGAPAPPSASN